MPESMRSAATLRLNSRLARLLLLLSGILVALLIAEVSLRISGFTYFNPYIVDQDLGYVLRPGAEGWWTKEALTYVKINSRGFRDREHTIAKPKGTLRIAVLGDSFTEAFQVPLEKTFWSVIEREIANCPAAKSKVEVLSFGVSGFSTTRELILLRKRIWEYSPDVIVLQVTTGNDIRDNSSTLNAYPNEPLPYFNFRDGKLVLDDSLVAAQNHSLTFRLRKSFIGKVFVWMQNNLRVLGLVYTASEAYQSRTAASRTQKQTGLSAEAGVHSEVYREPDSPEWLNAWQVTDGLIAQMHDEVSAKGAKFLVVTGSMGIQVSPDASARQDFLKRLGVNSPFYPDEHIKALGEREDFPVLNLAPALGDYATRNKVFLHGSSETMGRGHWNETGHKLAGELIARELCKLVFEEN